MAHRDDAKREGWTMQVYGTAVGNWWRISSIDARFEHALAAWEHVLGSCHKSAACRSALEFLAKWNPKLFIERACVRRSSPACPGSRRCS